MSQIRAVNGILYISVYMVTYMALLIYKILNIQNTGKNDSIVVFGFKLVMGVKVFDSFVIYHHRIVQQYNY